MQNRSTLLIAGMTSVTVQAMLTTETSDDVLVVYDFGTNTT